MKGRKINAGFPGNRLLTALAAAVAVFVFCVPGQALAQWSTDTAVNNKVVKMSLQQSYPSVIHDGKGGYFVMWDDRRGCGVTGRAIYAQYYNAAGVPQWPDNGLMVVDNPDGQKKPCGALDGAGGIVIMWTDSGEDFVGAQRLDAAGNKLWAPEGVKVIDEVREDSARCCTDGAGGLIIVTSNGKLNRVTVNGTLPWAPADDPIIYDDDDWPCGRQIVSDGQGGAFFAWLYDGDNIAVQRVDASGNLLWNGGNPQLLTTHDHGTCPRVNQDGLGNFLVIWEDERTEHDRLFAQKISPAGASLWPETTPGDCGVLVWDGSLDWPSHAIVPDGTGGALVRWVDHNDENMYAQRLASADGAPMWCPVAQLIFDGTYDKNHKMPKYMQADGAGGFVTIWSTTDDLIRAQRVDSMGNSLWAVGGAVLCNADGDYGPGCSKIESNGQGGAVGVWVDERDYNQEDPATGEDYDEDIYMMGINAAGQVGDPGWNGALAGITVASTNCAVRDVALPLLPLPAPEDFEATGAVSFKGLAVNGTADIAITCDRFLTVKTIYKVVGNAYKQIWPVNTTTGVTNVVLDGNRLTYTITDDGDCDSDPNPGTIADPVVFGQPPGAEPTPATYGTSDSCFIKALFD